MKALTNNRPINVFGSMDKLPAQIENVQKMLRAVQKNQRIQHDDLQKNNEAFVILNQQLAFLTEEIQMMNHYLSLLTVYQSYMFSDDTIYDDAVELRNMVQQEYHGKKEETKI